MSSSKSRRNGKALLKDGKKRREVGQVRNPRRSDSAPAQETENDDPSSLTFELKRHVRGVTGANFRARWGHSCVAITDDLCDDPLSPEFSPVLVFGGTGPQRLLSDMFVLTSSRSKGERWEEVSYVMEPATSERPNRYHCGMVYIPPLHPDRLPPLAKSELSHCCIISGGRGEKSRIFADVLVFVLSACRMTRYKVGGFGARASHTLTYVDTVRSCYMFGGVGQRNKFFDQVSVLDGSLMKFEAVHVKSRTNPPARAGHVAFSPPGTGIVYIFGGYNASMYFRDLWSFDTSTRSWRRELPEGREPPARRGHSASLIHGGAEVVITGGCTADGEFLDDAWVLDVPHLTWKELKPRSAPLVPRFCHASAAMSWNTVVIVGGSGTSVLLNDAIKVCIGTENDGDFSDSGSIPERSPSVSSNVSSSLSELSLPLAREPIPEVIQVSARTERVNLAESDNSSLQRFLVAAEQQMDSIQGLDTSELGVAEAHLHQLLASVSAARTSKFLEEQRVTDLMIERLAQENRKLQKLQQDNEKRDD